MPDLHKILAIIKGSSAQGEREDQVYAALPVSPHIFPHPHICRTLHPQNPLPTRKLMETKGFRNVEIARIPVEYTDSEKIDFITKII